jgi:GntR family transcriptional regulator
MKSLLRDEDVPDRTLVHIDMEKLVPDDLLGTAFHARISVEELERGVVRSTPVIRALLQREDSTVLMVEQLAYLDGVPLYLRVGYHPIDSDPWAVADRIRASDENEVQTLETAFAYIYGVAFGSSSTVVEAVRCEARAAELLQIPDGEVVLLREMVLSDIDCVPRSLSYTHFRSDRVALTTEVH